MTDGRLVKQTYYVVNPVICQSWLASLGGNGHRNHIRLPGVTVEAEDNQTTFMLLTGGRCVVLRLHSVLVLYGHRPTSFAYGRLDTCIADFPHRAWLLGARPDMPRGSKQSRTQEGQSCF